MIRFSLILAMGIILTGFYDGISTEDNSSVELPEPELPNPVLPQEAINLDIFVQAEKVTGCSAEVLRGIAGAESHFTEMAVGDNGLSHGMFQLHSQWHDYRVEKYGEFDPFDPADAAIIAGYIIQENLRAFKGDLRLAIAAYRQGVAGVLQKGATDWYVDSVLLWRNDPQKMLAFFIFQGITDTGEIEDEYFSIGTQLAYQSGNTFAAEVSWRGRSGIPF